MKNRKKPTVKALNKFIINYGIDNYEVVIDLSEVVYIKTSFDYDARNDKWNYKSTLIFKSGHTETVHLTEKGYEELRLEWLSL